VGKPPSVERETKKNGIGWEGAGPPIQQKQQEKGKTQQRKVLQRSISVSPCLICTDDAPWPEGFDDSLLASLLCECNNSITWYILVLVARVRNTQWIKEEKKKSNLKIGNDKGTYM
jgi:hypothetical protein